VQLRPRNNGTPGEGRGINTINWVPPLKDAAIRRTRTSPTLLPRKCEDDQTAAPSPPSRIRR
jgi:hypothetical protein